MDASPQSTPLADAYRLALARSYVHVTRVSGGDVYGHTTDHCDSAGCAGLEQYYPADHYPALYAGGEPTVERGDEADLAVEELDAAAVAAREAWRESDEPRRYEVRDEQASWPVEARPSALESAVRESVLDGDWDRSRSFVEYVRVTCEETGESESYSVEVPAEEPRCVLDRDREHDWQSPHEVVGGLGENPGVHGGENGGVRVTEVCSHCGRYRVVETRATDAETGRTYEATDYEDADGASLDWVESLAARDEEA